MGLISTDSAKKLAKAFKAPINSWKKLLLFFLSSSSEDFLMASASLQTRLREKKNWKVVSQNLFSLKRFFFFKSCKRFISVSIERAGELRSLRRTYLSVSTESSVVPESPMWSAAIPKDGGKSKVFLRQGFLKQVFSWLRRTWIQCF